MQVTVQLAPELEARLASEAQARGLALESYITQKLEHSDPPARDRKSVGEAIDAILEMRKGQTLGGISIRELIDEGRKY